MLTAKSSMLSVPASLINRCKRNHALRDRAQILLDGAPVELVGPAAPRPLVLDHAGFLADPKIGFLPDFWRRTMVKKLESIGEFGEGRPDFGGRRPAGEAAGHRSHAIRSGRAVPAGAAKG